MSQLTQERINHLKQRLEQRRDELRAEIQADAADSDKKNLTEMVQGVRDPGDDSVALELSDLNISASQKSAAELRAVEAALDRIEEGTYGRCADCGGEIPFERLEAYPTAERHTACQARRENLRRDTTPSL